MAILLGLWVCHLCERYCILGVTLSYLDHLEDVGEAVSEVLHETSELLTVFNCLSKNDK